jgi:chorismate synthase
LPIEVRELRSPEEYSGAEQVQKSAWGMEDIMVTPKEIMIAMATNGGIALGAFKGERMIGMSIAFPGIGGRAGRAYLYSHMTGVSREFQSKGVGYLLKMKQREIALDRGFDLAAWTFDPLIARNAHFNFSKLGVISRVYFPDYYGPMKDSINFGWYTDRFLAESFLLPGRSETVQRLRSTLKRQLREAHVAVKTRDRGDYLECSDWEVNIRNPLTILDMPRDIVQIKKSSMEDAKRWRLATRELFQSYFQAGFTALDLIRRGRDFGYLLTRARIPRLIVPVHRHDG